MKKKYITLLMALLAVMTSVAQVINDTINRMVLVESTYNPIIGGAVKRNFIPEEVKPIMNKEQVVYADENVDLTNFDREAKEAQAIVIESEKGTPGYAHLGYGNYNNLSGLAAYNLRTNEYNNWAFKAHVDGWNGKLRIDDNAKWASHLYDMGIQVDYNTQLGDMALSTGLRSAYYNYNYLVKVIPQVGIDVQNAYDIGAYIGLKGSISDNYYYQANIGYAHFGRSTYFTTNTPHSEGNLHVEASLGRDLYEWGMAKLLVRSDVLSYKGIDTYNNYHSLTITPCWDCRYDDFLFVSGFNLDILTGENINKPVQVSPECSISYVPDGNFTAKFTLDGGRDIHTFNHLYTVSPYWAAEKQIRPTYTFMNAHLEGNVRVMEGFHLHLGGGYKILSNALFETVMDSVGITYTGITNHTAQVVTLDAAVSYGYKDFMNLSVRAAYHHWMLKGDRVLLARAPQLKIDVDARARIIPQLYAYTNLQVVSFTKVIERERAIVDWSLGANYALNKHLSFFLDAHNLLNHRHSYYAGYPSQGFNVLMGAMVKF